MNPVPLFLIIVTLPLLLGGCGEKATVNEEDVEEREGIIYLKGSNTTYTGEQFLFYENGQKKAEINFKNGKPDGLFVGWYENGQKMAETNFKDGKPDGLAVGWHENGKKKMEGSWKNDKEDGLHTQWHENGQKNEENNWKDGKQEGLAVGWHENGQKRGEVNFKNGEAVSRKLWNRKGEPVDTIEEALEE